MNLKKNTQLRFFLSIFVAQGNVKDKEKVYIITNKKERKNKLF